MVQIYILGYKSRILKFLFFWYGNCLFLGFTVCCAIKAMKNTFNEQISEYFPDKNFYSKSWG